MKCWLLGWLLAIAIFTEPGSIQAKQMVMASARLQGYANYVFDGDSLICICGGQKLALRLYGIDAPEKGQPQAEQARQHLQTLVLNHSIQVKLLYRDRYQRWIAQIILSEGQDAGQEMVKAGLAWWYRQYAPHDITLARLENSARQAHRGIWSQADPTAPWLYRAQRRHQP